VTKDANLMRRLTLIVSAGLVATSLSACDARREPAAPQPPRQPIAVTAVRAAAVDTVERLEAGGIVSAEQSALVASRIVATILTVHVRAGDRVRTGDVLLTLDARDVAEHTRQARASALAAEKALMQAQTEQSAAEAEQRLATAWHQRISALHARNSATDQERDEAEARLAGAAAHVAGARAAIEVADAHLASSRAAVGVATTTESFTELRAPFAGLVTERLSDPGNLATPGTPLLRIESDAIRQVAVRVDEARAAYVRPGDRVEVVIDALGDSAAAGTELEGTITEVARDVGVDQRAFTVKVELPRTVTARTGTFARVFFRGSSRRALLVPTTAVRRHGQMTSVFVVENAVARLRLVQAGLPLSTGVELLAGVEAGELIVTSPPPGLVDGSPVTVSATGARPEATP
jgi:RND family efflux transporter MFP subunit